MPREQETTEARLREVERQYPLRVFGLTLNQIMAEACGAFLGGGVIWLAVACLAGLEPTLTYSRIGMGAAGWFLLRWLFPLPPLQLPRRF
jgi:hypothetical protein